MQMKIHDLSQPATQQNHPGWIDRRIRIRSWPAGIDVFQVGPDLQHSKRLMKELQRLKPMRRSRLRQGNY